MGSVRYMRNGSGDISSIQVVQKQLGEFMPKQSFQSVYMLIDDRENQVPSVNAIENEKLKKITTGAFGGKTQWGIDQEHIITQQHRKLSEMRVSQMNYFDTRMVELQERRQELDKRELAIASQEQQLRELSKRLDIEKLELNQIRQLLRVENESLRISSKDLRDQIRKYEVVIKMMMRNHPNKASEVTGMKQVATTNVGLERL